MPTVKSCTTPRTRAWIDALAPHDAPGWSEREAPPAPLKALDQALRDSLGPCLLEPRRPPARPPSLLQREHHECGLDSPCT